MSLTIRFTEVPEYIGNLLSLVQKLHSRIFYAQENIAALLRMIYSWAKSPILERKDFKDENLLAVGERDENVQKRYNQIKHASRELNRILDENYKLFFDLLPDSVYEKDEFELDKSNSNFLFQKVILNFLFPKAFDFLYDERLQTLSSNFKIWPKYKIMTYSLQTRE